MLQVEVTPLRHADAVKLALPLLNRNDSDSQGSAKLIAREGGLISVLHGSARRARKYLDESLTVAERQGAGFEHAQTRLARGRVGLTFDWPGSAEELSLARQALVELRADCALEHLAAST